MESKCVQLQRDIERLSADNARLRADYLKMKNERDRFRGESAKVREELGRTRVCLAAHENETVGLQNRHDAIICELADLQREIGRKSPRAITDGDTDFAGVNPSHSPDNQDILMAIADTNGDSGSGLEDPTQYNNTRNEAHIPMKRTSHQMQNSGNGSESPHATSSSTNKRMKVQLCEDPLLDTSSQRLGADLHVTEADDSLPNSLAPCPSTMAPIQTEPIRSHSPVTGSTSHSPLATTPEAELDQVLPTHKKIPISQGPESIKVEKDTIVLPRANIAKYTENIPAFIIDPPPLSIALDREFLGTEYGCPFMRFIATIPPKKNPSSRKSNPSPRHVVLPIPNVNPYVPNAPGEPGLLFSNRCEVLDDNPWTLIVRVSTKPRAIWRYFGEYECESRGSLMPEEFNSQKEAVKQAWATKLLEKTWPVYARIRARISLRKQKMLLTEETITAEMNSPTKGELELEKADVINALCRGDEEIKVIGMQCIAYDHHFARDMAAKLKVWNSPAAVEKRKREKAARKALKKEKDSKGKNGKGKNGKRKKASKHVRDEESSEDEDDMVQVETPSKRVSRRVIPHRAVRPHISSEDEGNGESEFEDLDGGGSDY